MVAESDHQRRVEPRADEQLGIVGREHRQRVRAVDALERSANRREEIALVVGLDEVRHDLGVRVRCELVALRLQLGLELGEVLDDAVVHDEDLAVAVGVRVRVDVGGLAVRGPSRVSDAHLAGGHVGFQLLDQRVDLGL